MIMTSGQEKRKMKAIKTIQIITIPTLIKKKSEGKIFPKARHTMNENLVF